MNGVAARFDDLRAGGRGGWELTDPHRTWSAWAPEEVPQAIERAQAAAAAGRWVAGFIAYEAAPAFDPALPVRDPVPGLPLTWWASFRSARPGPPPAGGPHRTAPWEPELDFAAYRVRVGAVSERILAGDTYQTNFTMRLRGRVEGDLRSFYRLLAEGQRGGYNAFLSTGRWAVVSASPEMFFRWDGRRVETRPMKGTAPRGRWEGEDRGRRERLLASGKDRAENVMVVDLVRNDLGRAARFGTVAVEELFGVQRLETVWQLTSTVAAETRPGTDLCELLAAMFPCGSVTGAPKAATMNLIRSLETSPRGVYCGAVGLLAPPDSGRPRAEFSVAIRTAVVNLEDRSAEYGTGGGIVHESTAAGEYAEAMSKARVLTVRRPPVTLLETMRWDPGGGIWLRERHLNRMRSSARYFGFDLPEAEIAARLRSLEEEGSQIPLRVRLLAAEDGETSLEWSPMVAVPAVAGLAVDDRPVDRWDRFRYHKTTRRGLYEEAALRHPGADDVILVNERREAVETTVANLAVRLDDEWLTPPLDAGCLPGTYREELIDQGALREHPLPAADLPDADELAVINSVHGWRPAKLTYP